MNQFKWQLAESRFLNEREVKRMRSVTEERSKSGKKSDVRDWLIIDLALSTGLRLSEVADLRCGDLQIDGNRSALLVRKGKGGRSRIVKFSHQFKEHLREYLDWKKRIGEETHSDATLLVSDRTGKALTKRAIQKAYTRSADQASIRGHRFHDLRHTYAAHLYKASKYNLRLVQKQLGHSSVVTTQVYADVLNSDLDRALKNLYPVSKQRKED